METNKFMNLKEWDRLGRGGDNSMATKAKTSGLTYPTVAQEETNDMKLRNYTKPYPTVAQEETNDMKLRNYITPDFGGNKQYEDMYNTGIANAEKRKKDAEAEMQSRQATYEAQKRKEQEWASIEHDKLLKYLPMQQKLQGLGGLGGDGGLAASTQLQANNMYQNDMGRIGGNYQKSNDELLRMYIDTTNDIDTQTEDENTRILREYANHQKEYDTNLYNNSSTLLQQRITDLVGANADGKMSAAEKEGIVAYAKTMQDKLSVNSANLIDTMLNDIQVRDTAKQAEVDKEKIAQERKLVNNDVVKYNSGFDKLDKLGNNFIVKNGSIKYKVENGGATTDKYIKDKAKDYEDGAVFGCDGQVYVKRGTGIYKIQKRETDISGDFENFIKDVFGEN